MKKIRNFLIRKLLSYNEKWFVYKSLQVMIDQIENAKVCVSNRLVDVDNLQEDVSKLNEIKKIFMVDDDTHVYYYLPWLNFFGAESSGKDKNIKEKLSKLINESN